MLYDEPPRRVCALCQYARDFRGDEMLCMKKGPVSFDFHCRHFCYDPLKRVPPRPATLNDKYTSEDFSL